MKHIENETRWLTTSCCCWDLVIFTFVAMFFVTFDSQKILTMSFDLKQMQQSLCHKIALEYESFGLSRAVGCGSSCTTNSSGPYYKQSRIVISCTKTRGLGRNNDALKYKFPMSAGKKAFVVVTVLKNCVLHNYDDHTLKHSLVIDYGFNLRLNCS